MSMIPDSQLSKPLEFSKPVESDKSVFYINEETFGKQLDWGLLVSEVSHVIGGLEFSVPFSDLQGGERS